MTDQPYETETPPGTGLPQHVQDAHGLGGPEIPAEDDSGPRTSGLPVPVHDEPYEPQEDETPEGWTDLSEMELGEKVDEILSLMRAFADQVEAIKTQANDNPMGLIGNIMSDGPGALFG